MSTQRAFLITDLQYGDAGKGSLVDYLARQHDDTHTVIRYNGGSQAAHNVITPDGRHHTFAQFGSAMFLPYTRTHLSRFMLIDPLALRAEARHLASLGVQNVFERTTIDRAALVITPYQQATNRLRELARGAGRHGSCGMGIGETMSDYLQHGDQVVLAGDLADVPTLKRKLTFLRETKRAVLESLREALPATDQARELSAMFEDDEFVDVCCEVFADFAADVQLVDETYFAQMMGRAGTVIFEGAQGVLLDEWFGFHPYTTWSTTTLKNAQTLLDEVGYSGEIIRYGLVRGTMSRHGAGPFVTEDVELTRKIPDMHNGLNDWQGNFRIGHFDAVAIRYATAVVGEFDGLVVSNLDRMVGLPTWRIASHYTYTGTDDISPFFETDATSRITNIRVSPAPDLTYQAALTHHFEHCTPHYLDYTPQDTTHLADTDLRAYLDSLAQAVGKPVRIISAGATANDKTRWSTNWLFHNSI